MWLKRVHAARLWMECVRSAQIFLIFMTICRHWKITQLKKKYIYLRVLNTFWTNLSNKFVSQQSFLNFSKWIYIKHLRFKKKFLLKTKLFDLFVINKSILTVKNNSKIHLKCFQGLIECVKLLKITHSAKQNQWYFTYIYDFIFFIFVLHKSSIVCNTHKLP